MPQEQQAYIIQGLHKLPHGNELVSNKQDCDNTLLDYGINHRTIVSGGIKGYVDLREDWGAHIFYPNHFLMKDLKRYYTGAQSIVEWAVCADPSDIIYDVARAAGKSSIGEGSLNRRVRFGFGQNQPEKNKQYRAYSLSRKKVIFKKGSIEPGKFDSENSLSIPTMSTAGYHILPPEAKCFIARVAEMGHRLIRKYCGKDAMRDNLRHNLFSRELNKELLHPSLLACFEYYDIIVTSPDVTLNRHMDVSESLLDNIYTFYFH